jgi:hypothetical protein
MSGCIKRLESCLVPVVELMRSGLKGVRVSPNLTKCKLCLQAVELRVKASSSAEAGDTGTFKVQEGVTVYLKGVSWSREVGIFVHWTGKERCACGRKSLQGTGGRSLGWGRSGIDRQEEAERGRREVHES